MLASTALGLVGTAATFPLWAEILNGMGVRSPRREGATVFFTTQVGKYLPGSVWPALMQMDAGRRWGAAKAAMLWANLSSLILNCAVGLSVACVFLPVFDAGAFQRYWWVLLAIPALIGSLHPRVLPAVIDRTLVILRRAPLHERLDPRSELRAAGWSLVSWVAFGGQLAVLAVASGVSRPGVIGLSIGAMALAVPLGVLFLPAPAGAGVREVILVLVLGTVMPSGQALALALGSRAILVVCDLLLAGTFGLTGLRGVRTAARG